MSPLQLLLRDPAEFARKVRRRFAPMRADYRKRLGIRLDQWIVRHQREIVFERSTWMGIPCFKNPLDAWIYQEIFHEVRPQIVVEIGSAVGGSTLYFCHLLDLLGGDASVISIDIERSRFRATHPRIVVLTGDSASPAIVARVADLCRNKRTLVIQDGDHARDGVLRDLEAYAPLVSPGSYLVVEDGVQDLFRPGDSVGTMEPGPLAASEDFVARHPEFEVDESRERYLITYNPRGFLRRKP